MLDLPTFEPALAYLESVDDPTIQMRLARLLDPAADMAEFRPRLTGLPIINEALGRQRSDGSWGDHDRAANRILPTLWMVKTLGELGLDRMDPRWDRGVGFLTGVAHTEGGVFSISGRREGVLSCYVGIAALVYVQGGYEDLAQPQLDWIVDHQEVKAAGRDRREEPAAQWGAHLATKYGGCMAETTCLVGLLRTGRALAAGDGPEGTAIVEAIREVFLERRLMYTSSGSVVPLAVSPNKADSWLAPTFPLDWRIDLIEVVDFVANTGAGDGRLQDAIDKIVEFRLPDGTWPLRRSFPPQGLKGLARPHAKRPSPMATLRVVEALCPLRV